MFIGTRGPDTVIVFIGTRRPDTVIVFIGTRRPDTVIVFIGTGSLLTFQAQLNSTRKVFLLCTVHTVQCVYVTLQFTYHIIVTK